MCVRVSLRRLACLTGAQVAQVFALATAYRWMINVRPLAFVTSGVRRGKRREEGRARQGEKYVFRTWNRAGRRIFHPVYSSARWSFTVVRVKNYSDFAKKKQDRTLYRWKHSQG